MTSSFRRPYTEVGISLYVFPGVVSITGVTLVIRTDGAGSGVCVWAEFLCMKYLLELASGQLDITQLTPTVLTNRYRSKPKTLPYCRASRSTVCA